MAKATRLALFLSLLFLASSFSFLPSLSSPLASAQTGNVLLTPPAIRAVISGSREVQVGKTLVLDGSLSSADPDTVTYLWRRDGEIVSRTEEAVLTLERPGNILMTLTVRDRLRGEQRESEVSVEITAYLRKLLLMAGPTVSAEKLALHRESGEEVGVFVDILHAQEPSLPLGTEDALTKLIAENLQKLAGTEAVVLWAEGGMAMNALSRALRQDPERLALITSKTIVLITEGGLQTLARVIRGPFSVLHPARVIITRKEAINPLIEVPTSTEAPAGRDSVDAFLAEIERRDIDFTVVDRGTFAIRPWNLLSTLVHTMVMHGVSSEMVILLLMLPVILTIITFLKQVIGVTTFGLYTPAVITLSFVALGWKIGLMLLLLIVAAGYLMRAFMARYRLLYVPKIAVILTVISLVLLVVLAVAAIFEITLEPDTIFILLIMTTLSEEFMSVKAEQGLRTALTAILETVLVALLCTSIVQWSVFTSLLLAYPEIIVLTLLVNISLGRWTGLRLSEVVRFREIFKAMEE
jgi:hypothetical protein